MLSLNQPKWSTSNSPNSGNYFVKAARTKVPFIIYIIFGKKDQTLIKTISIQVIVAVQVRTAKVCTASHPNYILTFSSAKFFVRSIFLGANVYF